ncbi:MAG TPA: hypothetical protein VIQ62_07315, partial [Burkholderiales bacterium]
MFIPLFVVPPGVRGGRVRAGALALALCLATPLQAEESPPGATVESLLAIARERNPEYSSMRLE